MNMKYQCNVGWCALFIAGFGLHQGASPNTSRSQPRRLLSAQGRKTNEGGILLKVGYLVKTEEKVNLLVARRSYSRNLLRLEGVIPKPR
jgi:hypothetical protein